MSPQHHSPENRQQQQPRRTTKLLRLFPCLLGQCQRQSSDDSAAVAGTANQQQQHHQMAPMPSTSQQQQGRRRHSAIELFHRVWRPTAGRQNRSASSCSLLHPMEWPPGRVRAHSVLALEATLMAEPVPSFAQILSWALLQISVDTMAITALPLDCWLKERLKNWVQLSGHQGTIVPASNHSLWKKQPQGNRAEAQAYTEIMRDPALRGITPKFFREIQHRNEAFIEIQDLLAEFPDTASRAVMDIKIGTRTFLESEVSNGNKRADLYRKMVGLAPDEPTEQEHADGAITKLRYMQFRERKSSSATLGFRIEAAQLPGGSLQKDFKRLNTRQQVRQALLQFFGERRHQIACQIRQRLEQIRAAVENSHFFRIHEVVGSSLLLVYDQRRVGAWLIDFAKCSRMEEQRPPLTHRAQWELGNHEDGYLIGLDNLIQLLGDREGNDEEEEDEDGTEAIDDHNF